MVYAAEIIKNESSDLGFWGFYSTFLRVFICIPIVSDVFTCFWPVSLCFTSLLTERESERKKNKLRDTHKRPRVTLEVRNTEYRAWNSGKGRVE